MRNKLLIICLTILVAALSQAQELHAPGISHVEPLTAQSALVTWDSVDAGAVRIRVLASEHTWSNLRPRAECDAARGWAIIAGLEPRRAYRLQLVALSESDSASGVTRDYTHNQPRVDWVFVPGGDFQMGSINVDAAPPHPVRLSPYLLSATEITNRDYLELCSADSLPLPEDPGFAHLREYLRRYPDFPVVNIAWEEAAAFCNGLSRRMKLPSVYDAQGAPLSTPGVRLPTEAEWEHAASLAHGAYPWGSARPTPAAANFSPSGIDSFVKPLGPVAVKTYPPTDPGLYDMAGNVWEWCQDWYGPYRTGSTILLDPLGPADGNYKVVRGGSWADSAATLQTANRGRLSPSVSMSTVGFRVARSLAFSSPKIVSNFHPEERDESAK